jgi:proton glutamate symport protein
MNLSTRILLGLFVGLGAGIFYSMADGQALASLPEWVEPIGTLWVNAIRMTVVPLIVALLITSIAGGDRGGLVAKLGAKTIALFVVMVAGASLYALILAPPLLAFLHIDPGVAAELLENTNSVIAATAELPPFRDWLVGLVPTNPLKAAVETAMLPLLVFTVLFSLALLNIEGAGRETMLRFFTALKDAMLTLVGWIMLVAPLGVFGLVFPLAARMGISAVTALGSFILIACSLITLMMLLLYPLAVFAGRLPLTEFARAVAPVQVIGFSTRSSLASLPATVAATDKLGISDRVSGLVLPVAVSLFKFASPIGRTTGTYFVAQLYGIELGATEMIIVAMAIGLFSFYSPGIPSGGLLIMAPVYISLGLPVEGIGILIAIDVIIDMFITATNVTANVTAAAILTRADRAPSH